MCHRSGMAKLPGQKHGARRTRMDHRIYRENPSRSLPSEVSHASSSGSWLGCQPQLPGSSLRAAVGRGAIAASHRTDRCWRSCQAGPQDYNSQESLRLPAPLAWAAPPPCPLGAVVPPPHRASPAGMLLLGKALRGCERS